jgi:arginine N-succinyltransferase
MNFRLRSAVLSDLDDLLELSQLVTFINLPPDQRIIQEKLQNSERSFKSPSKELWRDYYIFVLEDISKSKVIGASMIHAQHGTEDEPHFYLKVDKEQKYSESINTGFIHGTLKLGYDTNGPTEIGGLVLHPDYRGNSLKLGKQLSYVRFLYIGMYPKRFKEMIHSELMPPLDEDGNSPLWEAIGRRFLNMDYQAADVLSRQNKEFILSLYPSDTIYETLLPIEARHAIGKVGKETEPVKKMLQSIGFKYTHEVDPFDGGPHYRAKQSGISLIKNMGKAQLRYLDKLESSSSKLLVNIPNAKYHFESAVLDCVLKKGADGAELFSSDDRIKQFASSQTAETFYIKF